MSLTVDQLIELEALAHEQIAQLEGELASGAEEAGAIAPDKAIGRLSRLDAMQIQEMAKEAQRRREDRLHRLHQAIERMDVGSYGRCASCGEEIEYQRLEIAPEITRCGPCARS